MSPLEEFQQQLASRSVGTPEQNWQNAFAHLNPTPAPTPQAPQQHGNFLTHLLPTIGGTAGGVGGGAIGGALAGSAILPGVGTVAGGLLGALLGGAAGGAAGKVAENKVENQSLGSGVGGQALEQGILSAGPLRLLKGAGAAGKVLLNPAVDQAAAGAAGDLAENVGLSSGNKLVDALNAAGQAGSKPLLANKAANALQNGAANRSANGFGLNVGGTIGGKTVTPDIQAALKDWADNQASQYGDIRPGSPINQAQDAQNVFNNVTNSLNKNLDTINRPVTAPELQGVNDAINQSVASNPALTANPQVARNFQNLITQAPDIKSLEGIRQAADNLAFKENGLGGDSQVAQQAGHVRDAIDQYVTNLSTKADNPDAVAAYKATKGDYQNAKQLLDMTSNAANNAQGIKLPVPGGLHLPAQASQGVKNVANAKLENAAGNVANATANPHGLLGVAGRTVPLGLADALLGAQSNMANTTANTQSSTNSPTSTDMTGALQGNTDLSSQTPVSNSPYTQADLMNDVSRDPANAAKYISTYQTLDKIFNPTGTANGALTTNQKNEVVSQQKAMDSLNQYVSNLNAAGGGEGPLMGALNGSILGNYTNPAAKAIDAQRIDIASAIAGSLNPRGTVSPVTARLIADSLPSIHDTPAAVKSKIANVMSMIQSGAFSATTPTSSLSGTVANGQ